MIFTFEELQKLIKQRYWNGRQICFKPLKNDLDLKESIEYYSSFLPDETNFVERINILLDGYKEYPKCIYCGKEVTKYQRTLHSFSKTCSKRCTKLQAVKNMNNFIKDTYGVNNASQVEEIKNKKKQTSLQNHGVEYPQLNKKIRDKSKQTLINKYGVDHPSKSIEIRKKTKKTMMERYGAKSSFNSKEILQKIKETNIKKYGTPYPIQNKEINKKAVVKNYETRKKNNTFNTSKIEKEILVLLKSVFKEVKYQYKTEQYPFNCDYYLPEYNLYIELQGNWTHGNSMFNVKRDEDKKIIEKWKKKNTPYYNNAIKVWTESDPLKRDTARSNNLNWLEIFSYKDFDDVINQIQRIIEGLSIFYDKLYLLNEYTNINKSKGDFNKRPTHNKIILHYQPHFFEVENYIYQTDPIKRRKLIENRIEYLNKEEYELTDIDLLKGFKRSGIYYGFSHFSPLWIKAFIEQYDIKSIYDPCGGWGHRLLGCKDLLYIYNDLDERSCKGVNNIINDYSISNKIVYNNDASNFTPDEDYECVFTCPPYYTTEEYTYIGSASDITSYNEFLEWWKKVVKSSIKQKIKYFAYVISNKYKEGMNKILLDEGLLFVEEIYVGNNNKSGYLNKVKDSRESIQVFKKLL